MKIIAAIFFLSALSTPGLKAGNDKTPSGGRAASMGMASVALSDFWAVQNNQAGLALFNNAAAGIYFENRYLLRELSRKSIACVLPSPSGVFGLSYDNFGSRLYNENKLGLAFARSFGSNFSSGIQLDYLSTHVGENFGNRAVLTFEAGIQARVNPNLLVGAHVFNPLNVKLSREYDESIPAIIRVGAVYTFSKALIWTAEIEKIIDLKARIKSGAEYQVTKQAFLRAGIATNPLMYAFGIGLDFKNIKIDLGSSVHQVLGYSPQASISYYF